MAINKKLIHFGKLADFKDQLSAGNILDYSIVFIQDAKQIWTHGTFYNGKDDIVTDLSKYLTSEEIAEIYATIDMLNVKQDVAPALTVNNTNSLNAVSVYPNAILVFNTTQTFSNKTFNIVGPTDATKEYTWTIRFQLSTEKPNITFTPPSGYTLRWANNTIPIFNGAGCSYEITFKYIPGVNVLLGVCGEF